ncbi:MAG: hypothetical protein JOZ83_06770 [Silvibacterium sp.]|nr:hypothetical protein [Silvibacterium sp.]
MFGRPPGYNANEDNIVRSQARLLRLKLEHHFANDGRCEPVIISIPKGRYLPAFESRCEHKETSVGAEPEESVLIGSMAEIDPPRAALPSPVSSGDGQKPRPPYLVRVGVGFGVIAVGLVFLWFARSSLRSRISASETPRQDQSAVLPPTRVQLIHGANSGEIRIASGHAGEPFFDAAGQRWDSDNFYQGGASKPGPQDLFPPVPDPILFSTIREGVLLGPHAPSGFRYDIPVTPGVYELRLYFADPIRHAIPRHDGQHMRHFQVNLNGTPILTSFDAVADAGAAAVDIRAFRDVSPAQDGKVHLEFLPAPDLPFISAIELSPGTAGRLQPVRISTHNADLIDENGVRWSGDKYFVLGSTITYASPENVSRIPPLYAAERYGNFSYAIPVPAGSYTLRLHFMESFFGPSAPSGMCWGAGCRVFDVTCNGEMLLRNFDIYQTAGGDFRPIIRTFRGLHPNGQGKLLVAFSPRSDYAEVRAVEVIDEGQNR